jgi:hypothetical protein
MDEIIKELKQIFGIRAKTTTKYGDELRDLVIHKDDIAVCWVWRCCVTQERIFYLRNRSTAMLWYR